MGGAFGDGEMATAVDADEYGLGDEFVKALACGEGGELVLSAPDEKDGHFEFVYAEVEDFAAVEHAAERVVDDPGVAPKAFEHAMYRDGRHAHEGFVGLDAEEQLVEVGGGAGGEDREWEVDGHVEASTVEEQQTAYAVRVVESEFGGDPAAHGPAGDVGLLQVQGVEESGDDVFLCAEREVTACGPFRAAVAEQVERIDVIAVPCEGGGEDGPIAGAGTQAMNQNDGLFRGACGRQSFEVVDAVAGDLDLVVLDVVFTEVQVGAVVDEPERVVIEEDNGGDEEHDKRKHKGEQPFAAARQGHFKGFPYSSAKVVCARLKRPPSYLSDPWRWPMTRSETTQ